MPNICSPERAPRYRLHKRTGQAVVTIDGRDVYLGKYQSAKSREAYRRQIAEWIQRMLTAFRHEKLKANDERHNTRRPNVAPFNTVVEIELRDKLMKDGEIEGRVMEDDRDAPLRSNRRTAPR